MINVSKDRGSTCLTREDVVETEQLPARAFRCRMLKYYLVRKSSLLRIAPVDVIKLALLTLSAELEMCEFCVILVWGKMARC